MSQKNVDESNVSGNLTNNVVNQVQATVPTDDISNIVIIYQVTYLNQETCEKMVMVLQNEVESAAQKYVDAYGEYEFDQLQSVVAVTVDEKYLEKQKNSATLMDSYLTKLVTLENTFSDMDMVYYEKLYRMSEQANSTEQLHEDITVKDLIKWLIIGIVGFVIIWSAYYFLKYLLDPSIKTWNEIKKINLPVIGYTSLNASNENIIKQIQKKIDVPYVDLSYIVSSIDAFEKKNIIFCTDEKMSKNLEEGLVKKTENLELAGWLQKDVKVFKQAKNADGIIFGVWKKRTSMKQLKREVDICKMYNIRILGIVGIDE